MGNSQFRFKQFTIDQDRCAMKVGTDGVLLGAWADIDSAQAILDIGTGTGLIALMCAQRNALASIRAIEIDPSSAEQATENISSSKFFDRIEVESISLQDYRSQVAFDAIICNPPFFKAGTRSPTPERQHARHGDSLTIEQLLAKSKGLISDQGKLHMILPSDREGDLRNTSEEVGWHIEKLTRVFPNASRPSKRILVTCRTEETQLEESTLSIEKELRFDYTDEYRALTAAFYPKMR